MERLDIYSKMDKSGLFDPVIQSQIVGIEAILNECGKQKVTDLRQIAYILGTVYHEVAGTMQPIEEFGKGKGRTYGYKFWYNGKPYNDVPFIYYGRGFTQNTWRDIYRSLSKAAKKTNYKWDFENNPDLLLQIEPSAWASVYAMRSGLYTGVGLKKYFNEKATDWINARRIINVLDQAELIAGYSKKFYQSLK